MSEAQPMSEAHPVGRADPADHHGHGDEGPGSEPLGPIDYVAWAAGLGGILLGLAVAYCLVLATA